jgi:hypothetical protein
MATSMGHDAAACAAVMQQAQAECAGYDEAVPLHAESMEQPPEPPPLLGDRG